MKNLFNSFATNQLLFAVLLLMPLVGIGQKKKNKREKPSEKMELVINEADSSGTATNISDSRVPILTYEDRLEAMISKYGKNKGRMIADGKVWASISFEMALDSWGQPQKIQKSEIPTGNTEKWTYPEGRYLFFKNGRLQSWKK